MEFSTCDIMSELKVIEFYNIYDLSVRYTHPLFSPSIH